MIVWNIESIFRALDNNLVHLGRKESIKKNELNNLKGIDKSKRLEESIVTKSYCLK